jgi:hypothetical protein
MSSKSLAAVLALVLFAVLATPAGAQGLRLRFHDGLVTLTAQNTPLRTILAEWARLGGTTVVNAERVTSGPLTLELNAVPEAQALAVLLRNVSGYMAATRAAGTPGASVYDRILILPTSSAPRNPPPGPAGRVGGAFPRAVAPPPPPVQPDPEETPEPEPEPEEEVPADDDVAPVSPRLPMVGGARGQPFPLPRPNVQPDPDIEPAEEPQPEPEEEVQPQPGNPFGIPTGATSRPGVVTPAPRTPRTGTPTGDPDP